MGEFGIYEAKTRLSQLVDRARRGEDVVITRNGTPAVRLVPVAPADGPGARFLAAAGSLAGEIVMEPEVELTDSVPPSSVGRGRRLGVDHGRFLVPDDFDAPLDPEPPSSST